MNDEPSVGTWVAIILGVIILVVALAFGIHACSVADQATLGLAEQDVRTRNFEQSEAYRAGLRRDFDQLRLAYVSAKSADEKAAILSVIRHRASECPPDQIPSEIRDLLNQAKVTP